MELKLELKPRKPKFWEKKWKQKRPVLYLLERISGKWANTYWWEGNWRYPGKVEFSGPGEVCLWFSLSKTVKDDVSYLLVGRSGTNLSVFGSGEEIKIKSLHPRTSEWTCFGEITSFGFFTEKVSEIDFQKEIEKSEG